TGKFLDGRLVYAVNLKCLYLIGHDCADSNVTRAANREYARRIELQQVDDRLLLHLPLVPGRLALLDTLEKAAAEAERLRRKLRQRAGPLLRVLRQMSRQHGNFLVVPDDGQSETGDGARRQSVFVPVGTV